MELFMVIFVVILLIVGFIFSQYNKLIKLKKKVEQAASNIDVYCQQRFDLIPNLVETVKGYMTHEKEVLEEVTRLRSEYDNSKDMKLGLELSSKIDKIIAVAEGYPELKASENFLNLQNNLEKMESQLQAARRIYNVEVTNYNTKISTVPDNIIANMFKFEEEPLFEVADEKVKENVKVEF